ncbi:MAG TPA: hypothetical protein VKD72_08950, partial [Gemmataceae bacterium]|nr:hypothetical protein [Gemmataceae bacterium]
TRRLDDSTRVAALADRFDLLVKGLLLRQAQEVPADQRKDVLGKLAARLSKVESDARRLASETSGRPCSTSLARIAATARAADVQLRDLAQRA